MLFLTVLRLGRLTHLLWSGGLCGSSVSVLHGHPSPRHNLRDHSGPLFLPCSYCGHYMLSQHQLVSTYCPGTCGIPFWRLHDQIYKKPIPDFSDLFDNTPIIRGVVSPGSQLRSYSSVCHVYSHEVFYLYLADGASLHYMSLPYDWLLHMLCRCHSHTACAAYQAMGMYQLILPSSSALHKLPTSLCVSADPAIYYFSAQTAYQFMGVNSSCLMLCCTKLGGWEELWDSNKLLRLRQFHSSFFCSMRR